MADPAVGASASTTEADGVLAPDEDFSKEYEPVVRLAEVKTKTGEEDEEVIFKMRAKLFRFSKELSEWKERGTGDVRLLKHTENKKIRLLMRREKTLKICLNHYVNPTVELRENVGSDRSWVWHGVDYADGERDEALLAIRFRDSTNANSFKEAYDRAREYMKKLYDGELEKNEEGKDGTEESTATEAKEVAKAEEVEVKETEKGEAENGGEKEAGGVVGNTKSA